MSDKRNLSLPLPEPLAGWAEGIIEFYDNARAIGGRFKKPTGSEYKKVALYLSFGFLMMGIIGYVVKLMFIPVNNILMSYD